MKTVKTLHFDFLSFGVSNSVSFDYMYFSVDYNRLFVRLVAPARLSFGLQRKEITPARLPAYYGFMTGS